MAVFNEKCGGHKFKINDVDHNPPHCHVSVDGRNTQIDLFSLEILNPPPHTIPPSVRRCLKRLQTEMIKAWDRVQVS